MSLENIGGEIGNMVRGPDPEELCKPHKKFGFCATRNEELPRTSNGE